MRRPLRAAGGAAGLLALLLCGAEPAAADTANEAYDLVLAGGRVMDPESGLDAVRHVGIREDRIPRGAGTHARVLGHYVRERGTIGLMDAIAKLSLMPAQRLEAFVPAMARKGRVRVGADADLTVFDPETVSDRATFEDSLQYSEGIPHVIVAGSFVVRDGALVDAAFPGQAVRARVP